MRPDRIVVGECRGGEALDMLQAMNTGHDGSITTVHSNSPRDTLARIETMALMAGFDLPIRAIREQMASAIDLIVHLTRLRDGTRRITHITEVQGMEGDVITLQDIFLFDFGMGVDEHGRFTRPPQGHRRAARSSPRSSPTSASASAPRSSSPRASPGARAGARMTGSPHWDSSAGSASRSWWPRARVFALAPTAFAQSDGGANGLTIRQIDGTDPQKVDGVVRATTATGPTSRS